MILNYFRAIHLKRANRADDLAIRWTLICPSKQVDTDGR
jgi:hypothetical protein